MSKIFKKIKSKLSFTLNDYISYFSAYKTRFFPFKKKKGGGCVFQDECKATPTLK